MSGAPAEVEGAATIVESAGPEARPAVEAPALPLIIQGGMGIGVSGWRLARAVCAAGQLGVVSGTAVDTMFVRRLQDGDLDGQMRRAMTWFPVPQVADTVLARYYIPGGRAPGMQYKMLPMHKQSVSVARQQLTMLAAFVEVALAKEGHDGPVGINLLTKVQMPNLMTLYGAMLAGVDYVLMGAGIPREIPAALDALAEHRPASIRLDVEGLRPGEIEYLNFDPADHWQVLPPPLERPRFIAIVSAASLATTLARKATGRVDGFVIEGPTAGGHNAPPRGELRLSDSGEPIYGERDVVDLQKIRELGLPFWLAGGTGSHGGLRGAQAVGAAGVQVGTLFAFCAESGLAPELRARTIAAAKAGEVHVRTAPRASPTGYPFKLVEIEGLPQQDDSRERLCDLGYLRVPYRTPTGGIGYRCSAEPIEAFVEKGGDPRDAIGRRCLCNGLTANIGLPQRRAGSLELPLLTAGDDLVDGLAKFVGERTDYSAADVIAYILGSQGVDTA